jgi:hypothetical protein
MEEQIENQLEDQIEEQMERQLLPIDDLGEKDKPIELKAPVVQQPVDIYLVCFICERADGQLITPCHCGNRKPVHFECIRVSIIRNRSFICRTCQMPFEGIYPIFAHKSISRFLRRKVWPLLAKLLLLLISMALIRIKYRFRRFWLSFFLYLALVIMIAIIYAITGILYIRSYNQNNTDIVDVGMDAMDAEVDNDIPAIEGQERQALKDNDQ